MTEKINLYKVQKLLFEFAESKGMTAEEIHENWSVDYKHDRQKTFERDLNNLFLDMALFKQAMAEGDLLTAKSGLIGAGICADCISSDFEALRNDIRRTYLDFKWPDWPESSYERGHPIPAHYNYKLQK